jgi:hypothetical protein
MASHTHGNRGPKPDSYLSPATDPGSSAAGDRNRQRLIALVCLALVLKKRREARNHNPDLPAADDRMANTGTGEA